MASSKRRFKLSSVLISSIATLVLLSAGAVLAVQFLSSRHVMGELAGHLIESSISRLEAEIKTHLEPASSLVRFIAGEIESGRIQMEDTKMMPVLLTGALAAAPQVGSVLVMDETLLVSRITRDYRNQTYIVDRPDWQALGGAQQNFSETARRGTLYWGELLFSPRTGRSFLNARAPVRLNGTVIGVVAATVSVGELSELTRALAREEISAPFILYGADHVLAHPELENYASKVNAENPLVQIADMDDQVIASLPRAVSVQAGFLPGDAKTKIRQLQVGGVNYLVIMHPIEGYGDEPLIAGTYAKMDVVQATFRPFYIAGLIGLCILALAVLGAVLMSSRLAKPIANASKTARAIGDLDFDRMAPMANSSIAEIDDLAGSFNKMLSGLQTFGRYVPKTLVRKLVAGGHRGAGSEERELTVMFTDMRRFTELCEGKNANEVAAFINEHLTMLSECIEEEGGTIDKYIGDAVMAFWGAPDEVANSADAACRSALKMRAKIASSNEDRIKSGLGPIGLRIGIHSGMLVVGDIGSPNRINYTVVGDVVNTTQRLEALGKEIDGNAETIILLSRDTRAQLSSKFSVRKEGAFQLKGKRQKLDVFRLI
jgi:adenylate cyclase